MAAKRGGTRKATAATDSPVAVVAEPAVPAENTLDLENIMTAKDTAPEKAATTVEPAETVTTPDATAPVEPAPETPSARLSALAALTGAVPAENTPAPAPAVEAVATGKHVTWADGDKALVSAVVAVTSIQGTVDGNRLSAYKGETLHATAEVITRGVALGALVEV